tara:strand:- start:3911 stop:4129 length:219 start_codon:yes stop_codon:yes gene_type:complete
MEIKRFRKSGLALVLAVALAGCTNPISSLEEIKKQESVGCEYGEEIDVGNIFDNIREYKRKQRCAKEGYSEY